MKIRIFTRQLFTCLLVIILLASAGGILAADKANINHPDGIVTRCFDGDTVKLADRRVVRLAGIDSPELSHKGSQAQYYSRSARQALESLVRGKKVRLEFPGVNPRDRYGRLVADVIMQDGQSANAAMVEQGAAFFYPHQDLNPEYQENLLKLQQDAIHERRGMWQRVLSLPIAQNNYIGNRASLRFFPASCPEAQRIKPRNRVNFGTLMDAFLAGYAPARICPFWPPDL